MRKIKKTALVPESILSLTVSSVIRPEMIQIRICKNAEPRSLNPSASGPNMRNPSIANPKMIFMWVIRIS